MVLILDWQDRDSEDYTSRVVHPLKYQKYKGQYDINVQPNL